MAVKAWEAFSDGFRLINGTKLNRLFTAIQQMSAINVAGNATVGSLTNSGTTTLSGNVTASGTVTSTGVLTSSGTLNGNGVVNFGKASTVNLAGATSGTTTIAASATAGTTTQTFPPVTGVVASTSGSNLAIIDTYRCTAAQTANANIVPANITGLSGSVAIGTYEFEAAIYCTVASGTAGIAINQVLTTAVLSACNFEAVGFLAAGVATQATTTATSGTVLYTAANQPLLILIKGSFTVSTAGTFGLQMCQNTSNASNSVVNVGSTMRLTRIA
jgi:hypothetical protein